MILNKTGQTFSVEQHLCRGRFGWSPCSTLDVCSEAPQQKLLTQRSKNIRRNKERLSSQRPRPESGKQLTNPDVKSKLFQFPKHSYVTTLMDRWAPITAPHPCQICLWLVFGSLFPHPTQNGHFILRVLLTRGEVVERK